jgi:hypothetical protein
MRQFLPFTEKREFRFSKPARARTRLLNGGNPLRKITASDGGRCTPNA